MNSDACKNQGLHEIRKSLLQNPADHNTEDLVALHNALVGWDEPFDEDREALIDDIPAQIDSATRYGQPDRPGVVH